MTSGFDEYEALFLYASDLAVLLFLALLTLDEKEWLPRVIGAMPRTVALGGALMVLAAGVSVTAASSPALALYVFARLMLGMLFALGLAAALRGKRISELLVLGSLAASGAFQAFLAFLQFRAQSSTGFSLLGEPLLGPFVGGSAKIVVLGGALLRGYGTLPHPNVLAATLLVAFLAASYFWLRRPAAWKAWSGGRSLRSDVLLGVALFALATGLALTFSRAGWLAACVAAALLVFGAFFTKEFWIQAVRLAILLLVVGCLLFIILGWALFPRATLSREEPAVAYRLRYNDLAFALIKERPWGVGIGNQVLSAVERGAYLTLGMDKRWQWQPVHNVYLLAAAEIGLGGALGFVVMLGALLWRGVWRFFTSSVERLELAVAGTMLLALLALGFVDHYLWTLQPGRLLLWSVFGILLGLTVRSSRP